MFCYRDIVFTWFVSTSYLELQFSCPRDDVYVIYMSHMFFKLHVTHAIKMNNIQTINLKEDVRVYTHKIQISIDDIYSQTETHDAIHT